ncbi:hypothetical protein PI125_g23178 [Phytophthora idaei]|nr:hypothetical protein PI125_g23178 [Phytophthora idaei]
MGPIRKEYSHDLRCHVVQKWRAKVSTRTIGKELLIPRWIERTIIDFYKANGRCKPPPRPGRTPLTDARRTVPAVEANRDYRRSILLSLKELTIEMTTAQEYAFSTPELADGWSTGKPQMTDEERSDVVVKIDELKAWLTEWEASQKAAVTGLHTSGYV